MGANNLATVFAPCIFTQMKQTDPCKFFFNEMVTFYYS